MHNTPPATVGQDMESIDTPALLIDLDVYERNLARMARKVAGTGIDLRPHVKTHKCPIIAHQQMAHGAKGVCCQKVGEAEAMVEGGVHDVLISNQVVGAAKLQRLAALARLARIGVCVDDPGNVRDLDAAARQFGVQLDVLVEIDVGMQRCGVNSAEDALALARLVDSCSALRFRGIQAYHGSAQHIRDYAERRHVLGQVIDRARRTRELLVKNGLPCDVVSGAGTGTHPFEIASGLYNELQVGSYIFMDVDYLKNLGEDGTAADEFQPSLFVYTTVMSHPTAERAVVDAGMKALSVDSGLPAVADKRHIEYVSASDEHGVLNLGPNHSPLAIGERIRLKPGHCDPTVNLYDWFVAVRHGRVEGLWPISARGPGR